MSMRPHAGCETHLRMRRRRSLQDAGIAAAVGPGAVWGEHSLLLLEGSTALADDVFSSLQAAISKASCPPPLLSSYAHRHR